MENSSQKLKWYNKTWLVILLCILFFPLGLYALWKNETISKGWKIAVTIVIALIVFSQIGKESKNTSSSIDTSSAASQPTTETSKDIGIGEVLHTEYFDIVVNKVRLQDKINTGNEYLDKKAEEGNKYLIIDASFKNIDKESRMVFEGSVWINYNNKNYNYDKSEVIMAEGWGLFLDQINPLITKRTKLVYKIPAEIKGLAYWQPGRAGSDEKILLGDLK